MRCTSHYTYPQKIPYNTSFLKLYLHSEHFRSQNNILFHSSKVLSVIASQYLNDIIQTGTTVSLFKRRLISNIFRQPIPQSGTATLNAQSPYDLSRDTGTCNSIWLDDLSFRKILKRIRYLTGSQCSSIYTTVIFHSKKRRYLSSQLWKIPLSNYSIYHWLTAIYVSFIFDISDWHILYTNTLDDRC